MDKNFDITTEAGRKVALEQFDKWGWAYAPSAWLGMKVYDFFTRQDIDTIKAQKEAAIELIKAGRKQNVEKMKITLDQTAGLDLGGDIEGIPIKCKIGKSGHMTIEVEYE